MSLADIIAGHIATHGPMTLADYMQHALSHPEYGYYMRRDPFGVKGDFITAPEISQIFGEIIGAWCAHQWQFQGGGTMALVECGPGRGTLMKDALRATKKLSGFHESISVHMVETSPTLTAIQKETLNGSHGDITWHETLETLPDVPHLLITNEFLDALPIHQFIKRKDGTKERHVDVQEGRLRFVEIATQQPTLPESAPMDTIIEFCPAAEQIVANIAARIKNNGGTAIFIDYGYMEVGFGDTLQAVKNHQPHDPLEQPGEADITAHVNFAWLKILAEEAGADVQLTTQGEFLLQLGAKERLDILVKHNPKPMHDMLYSGFERLVAPEQMGSLFKVMTITQGAG